MPLQFCRMRGNNVPCSLTSSPKQISLIQSFIKGCEGETQTPRVSEQLNGCFPLFELKVDLFLM